MTPLKTVLVPALFTFSIACASAANLNIVTDVETQPFAAQARRVVEATDYLGTPLTTEDKGKLNAAIEKSDVGQIQRVLDPYCLFAVNINPEMRVKVAPGPARPQLVEQGWRQFLIKVENESGTTAALEAVSPNAQSLFESGSANTPSDKFFGKKKGDARDLWLDLKMFNSQPLTKSLTGLAVEYRIVQLYSRDAGKREARIGFNAGQGTQDIGFRNEVDMLFDCLPAHEVTLRVQDDRGQPTTASFVVRDAQKRVYPSQAKRLAPDFAFHPQVYRADGEKIKLPEGKYTIEFSRGPESIPQTKTVDIDTSTRELSFKAKRWIDPSTMGWWSGDHHIHAAGCAHYVKPTEGVHAQDMIRHCMGEDLKVGANLTWGPCFDYQKQFFCGSVDKVSQYPYLLRYDIEVSGFGSHQSGHLCLLRLREQMYPGGESKDHWPKLGLNTLKWAKKQGAVTGPAHTGWGLEVEGTELPNYNVPKFDGIGGNEYIVDVTHEVPGPEGKLVPAVDFLSMVDTPHIWELNIWYHTLNAGFRTRVSGETDFPCIYGEKVGLGRSYVQLGDKLDYDQWCEGIRQGRNYVSDGKSHLINFKANNLAMGEKGSELKLDKGGKVKLTAQVAAYLPEKENPAMQKLRVNQKPYWDVERARLPGTRQVRVEAVVNGESVASRDIEADGQLRDIAFDVDVPRSSWVAVRILPSSHTNPIFVLVDGKPIRSKRSIEWCLKGVDNCWEQKERFLKGEETDEGKAAYEHARKTYRKLLAEAVN
ncbi:MAG: CehA/McbA family metallohydrolase [Verrucomicrobia subdivision 3 bacterium]|nr:CehA/McbA family metallohydrolase [Limisphaerales bacterium]